MDRDKIIKYCNKTIEISLYVVAFFIPISRAILEIFISLAIFAWIIKKFASREKLKGIFYPNCLNLPILLYVLAIFASAIFSTNRGISFEHFFFKTAEYLLLFYVIIEVVDKRILKNMLAVLVLSVAVVGIDGVYQYFSKHDFLRHREIAIAERPERIHGPFNMPTDFSNYVVTILPLVASLVFLKFKKSWIKPVLVVISLLLFICLIFSASKSGWLALLLAIPFVLLLGNKKLFIISLLMVIVALSFFPLLSGTARDRILHFFDFNEGGSTSHRSILWSMGLAMFSDRPLLGQGLGTFMFNFRKFQPQDYPQGWGISYVHNCFLQIAAETGILGFLSFVSIITVLFFVSLKTLLKTKKDPYYYILSGTLTGIFAYLVGSFFDTSLYSLPLAVLFWFMVGLNIVVMKIIRLEAK